MFDAQQAIIDRIRYNVGDNTGGFKTIDTPRVFLGLQHIGQLLPAAIVFPGMGKYEKSWRSETQSWMVSIIISHIEEQEKECETERIAGDLIRSVITALHDWIPGTDYNQPLEYRGRPEPIYSIGYAEFPVRFETSLDLHFSE